MITFQEDNSGCFIENRQSGGKGLNRRPVRRLPQKSRQEIRVVWKKVAGGGGKRYSTLGYMWEVEPTEFADRLGVVSPHRSISLNCSEGAQISLRFLLPPALALMMHFQCYTMGHIWGLLVIALGTYIALARAQEHYFAVLLFSETQLLNCCCKEVLLMLSTSPGSMNNKRLHLPHTILSLCQLFLHQNLRFWDQMSLSFKLCSKP